MKTNYLLIISILFISASLSAQKYNSPVEYMNAVNQDSESITNDFWSYTKVIARGKNAKKVEKRRKELLSTIKAARIKTQKLPSYNGDISYRNAVVAYMTLQYNLLNEDYGKIVDLEEIAEQSFDAMEAYIMTKEQASDKGNEAYNAFAEAQQNFAEENNVNLISGELSKKQQKLENASAVNKYYNRVYLIFFKSHIQDSYLTEAFNANDINSIEQNRVALSEITELGVKELDTIPRFRNDASLKIGAQKMITFYKQVADVHSPKLRDFYLSKERFEKLNKEFESLSSKERTREKVDEYNEAVNNYNNSIATFNNTNNMINERRGKMLNEWNKTAEKFFSKMIL